MIVKIKVQTFGEDQKIDLTNSNVKTKMEISSNFCGLLRRKPEPYEQPLSQVRAAELSLSNLAK